MTASDHVLPTHSQPYRVGCQLPAYLAIEILGKSRRGSSFQSGWREVKGATSDPARGREYAHHPRSGKSQAFHVLLLLDVGWGENWGREGLCQAVPSGSRSSANQTPQALYFLAQLSGPGSPLQNPMVSKGAILFWSQGSVRKV